MDPITAGVLVAFVFGFALGLLGRNGECPQKEG